MVKAGVYLVARLAPAFADVGVWRPLVVTVGLVTMVAGGQSALRPFDLKQLLAFGTISQLGFLVVLFGIGRPEATVAGCALLLAHGLFKAALFMVVGIVDHETGTRDVRLPPWRPGWQAVPGDAVVGAASMAAVRRWPSSSPGEAYGALVDGPGGDRLVLAGIVAGSVLTAATASGSQPRSAPGRGRRPRAAPASHAARRVLAPAVVLAAATVVLGIAPLTWSAWSTTPPTPSSTHAHLALWLWSGTAPPLDATLAAGVGLFAARRPIAALRRPPPRPSPAPRCTTPRSAACCGVPPGSRPWCSRGRCRSTPGSSC